MRGNRCRGRHCRRLRNRGDRGTERRIRAAHCAMHRLQVRRILIWQHMQAPINEFAELGLQHATLACGHATDLGIVLVAVENVVPKLRCHHNARHEYPVHAESAHDEVRVHLYDAVDVHETQNQALVAAVEVRGNPGEVLQHGPPRHGPRVEGGALLPALAQVCQVTVHLGQSHDQLLPLRRAGLRLRAGVAAFATSTSHAHEDLFIWCRFNRHGFHRRRLRGCGRLLRLCNLLVIAS
mmetsp:Transcript_99317/g.318673  ORF Transcript_99317/g.318673 Transcript_99317/m.318673 type:complete len:238 (-) Transcript_99317:485-1198(-)